MQQGNSSEKPQCNLILLHQSQRYLLSRIQLNRICFLCINIVFACVHEFLRLVWCFLLQGYNTGYRYKGLRLLEPPPEYKREGEGSPLADNRPASPRLGHPKHESKSGTYIHSRNLRLLLDTLIPLIGSSLGMRRQLKIIVVHLKMQTCLYHLRGSIILTSLVRYCSLPWHSATLHS